MTNYGVDDAVRLLCGNILDTEYTDAEIADAMDAADSWINTKTQKSDWDSGDVQYNLIIRIANKKAAEFVLESYGPEFGDKVKDLRAECDALIKDIVDNLPAEEVTGADATLIIETSLYGSYPLNLQDDENATPFISTEQPYTI
jgi:hypothetical protein